MGTPYLNGSAPQGTVLRPAEEAEEVALYERDRLLGDARPGGGIAASSDDM